jgi:hypothetical protein
MSRIRINCDRAVLRDKTASLKLFEYAVHKTMRRGSLTGDFTWYVERSDEGVVTIDMSRLSPIQDGAGSLLELDVRVKSAAAGAAEIDLQRAVLNDGRLTLNAVPRAGADSTDGLITIERLVPSVHATHSADGADSVEAPYRGFLARLMEALRVGCMDHKRPKSSRIT